MRDLENDPPSTWGKIEGTIKKSPAQKESCWAFILQNPGNFLGNWFEVGSALQNFPEQREFCWTLVLQNPKNFLRTWFDLATALKYFPEQEEFCWRLVLENHEKFFKGTRAFLKAALKKIFPNHSEEDIKKYISDEIRKNAHTLSLASRTKSSFFSYLPNELLINISALTGNFNILDKKASEEIAHEFFGEPTRLKSS